MAIKLTIKLLLVDKQLMTNECGSGWGVSAQRGWLPSTSVALYKEGKGAVN